MPRLTSKGEKGKPRPGFSREEIDVLWPFMEQWQHKGRLAVEREMRPLPRDYVELLLYTGIRHGTAPHDPTVGKPRSRRHPRFREVLALIKWVD